MKKELPSVFHVNSITQQHQLLGLSKPQHPLISIVKFENMPEQHVEGNIRFTMDFYSVTLKKNCDCKIKYGQNYYDYDEGVMSFFAPHQIFSNEDGFTTPTSGWSLVFHPDFIRTYPLGQKIMEYGFFDYSINEALFLSDKEEESIEQLFQAIEKEYSLPIDDFSQDVLVSQLDLLLTFCNRYYKRQFITRKPNHNDLLSKVENVLNEYFDGNLVGEKGLPSVNYLGERMGMSPKYLSGSLRNQTGQSAQQHIHNKLISKAKQILTSTHLSVSEIAYELGFEHPQSFNKLFKNKTKQSPLEYRQSFN